MSVQGTSFKGDNQQQPNFALPIGLTALGGASGFAGGYFRGETATLEQLLAMPDDVFESTIKKMPEKERGVLQRVFDKNKEMDDEKLQIKIDDDQTIKEQQKFVKDLNEGLEGKGNHIIIENGKTEISLADFHSKINPILEKLGYTFDGKDITNLNVLNEISIKERSEKEKLEKEFEELLEKHPKLRSEDPKIVGDLTEEEQKAKARLDEIRDQHAKTTERVKFLDRYKFIREHLVDDKGMIKTDKLKGVLKEIYSLKIERMKSELRTKLYKPLLEELKKAAAEVKGNLPKLESYRKGGVFAAVGASIGLAIAALMMSYSRPVQENNQPK